MLYNIIYIYLPFALVTGVINSWLGDFVMASHSCRRSNDDVHITNFILMISNDPEKIRENQEKLSGTTPQGLCWLGGWYGNCCGAVKHSTDIEDMYKVAFSGSYSAAQSLREWTWLNTGLDSECLLRVFWTPWALLKMGDTNDPPKCLDLNPQIPWFIIFPAFDSIFSRNMTNQFVKVWKASNFHKNGCFTPPFWLERLSFTPVSRSRWASLGAKPLRCHSVRWEAASRSGGRC